LGGAVLMHVLITALRASRGTMYAVFFEDEPI
jgi:hypothetical protein